MPRRRTIAVIAGGLLLLLVLAFFLPAYVNANRWRGRVVSSLSAELGRPVSLSGVHLELLPLPSFTLDNFSVAEDASGTGEPVLRASTVTARLRLLPLWRGRIEVARISLDEASLNLKRTANGDWNFDNLLERAPGVPTVATARQTRAPRFPYIEVTGGRINIQRGLEKLPYCLTDADLAFWLDSPGVWRVRLRGSPARTDIPNSGLGTVRLEGDFERATGAGKGWRDSGVHLSGSWRQLPLGQLTRAVWKKDAGWRGEAAATLNLTGTLRDEVAVLGLRVEGLRRENFVPASPLDMSATCRVQVSPFLHSMTDASCTLPMDGGAVILAGNGTWERPETRSAHVKLTAVSVPAERLLDGIRCVRQGIAPDLTADGRVSAKLELDAPARLLANLDPPALLPDSRATMQGTMDWTGAALEAKLLQSPLLLPDVHFAVARPVATAAPAAAARLGARTVRSRRKSVALPDSPDSFGVWPVQSDPIAAALGAASPMTLQVGAGRQGFAVRAVGDADAGRLASLLKVLGMVRLNSVQALTGTATAALTLRSGWSENPTGPDARGTVSLSNGTLQTAWLPGPIAYTSGTIAWSDTGARLNNVSAGWAGSQWLLNAHHDVACDTPVCSWYIQARTPRLEAAGMEAAFHQDAAQRFLTWLRGDARSGWPPALLSVDADALTVGRLPVQQFSAGLTLAGTTLKITRLSAALLGGHIEGSGNWDVASGKAAIYLGAGTLNLAAAGTPWGERWGRGTAEVQAEFDYNDSMEPTGTFTAMLRNAALLGSGMDATPLAKFDTWQVAGTFGGSNVDITRSALLAGSVASGATETVGRVGYNRDFSLELKPSGAGTSQRVSGHFGVPTLGKDNP